MMFDLVSIIIINYNGKKWLKGCLDSVFNQTYKNIEVVCVDNASVDDSLEFIRSNYPQVKILPLSKNTGFSYANNYGAKAAAGSMYLFLNTDTVLEEDTIEKLVDYKDQTQYAIVGPTIASFEGKDLYNGKFLTIDFLGYIGWGTVPFYIEGCALLIDKVDFDKLGGFDADYFMYSEDIDLCWRALLYGMKIGISDKSRFIHYGGGSSEKTLPTEKQQYVVPVFRRYEVEKNTLSNLLKNYSAVTLLFVLPLYCLQNFTEALFYLLIGKPNMFKTIWRAFYWNIKNIDVTMTKRRIIQKNRLVSDRQLFKIMNFSLNKIKTFMLIGIPKYK